MSSQADVLGRVTAVVLCYDRLDEVRRNIPALLELVSLGLELVVVDNASSDGTREELQRLHQVHGGFVLQLNQNNLGVGAGRNSGWRRASHEFVITLDDDTRIEAEQVVALARKLDADDTLGVVSPMIVHPLDGRVQTDSFHPHPTTFHGACYMARRDVIEQVGLHDERCRFGGEELDLSIKVRAAGYSVQYVPSVVVHHNSLRRAQSVARTRRTMWLRNHTRILRTHFPAWHAGPWSLWMLVAHVWSIVAAGDARGVLPLLRAWWTGWCTAVCEPKRALVPFYSRRLGLRAQIRSTVR